MTEGFGVTATEGASAAPPGRPRPAAWVGYAAGGLVLVAAVARVWWGVVVSALVPGDGDWFGDFRLPGADAIDFWSRYSLAVVGALLAVALVRPWDRSVPRWGGPSGTRLLLKSAGTLHRALYRWSGGRVGGRLRGCPVLLLTTTGRKTGRARTWPLCYVVAGDGLVLVAAAGGHPRHPAWYLNLRANPRVGVHLGDGIRTMVARTAEGLERARLWERVVRQLPVAAGYQLRTSREIPVVILRPASAWTGNARPQDDCDRGRRWSRVRTGGWATEPTQGAALSGDAAGSAGGGRSSRRSSMTTVSTQRPSRTPCSW